MAGLNSLFDLADGMLNAFEGVSGVAPGHDRDEPPARVARGSSPGVRAVVEPHARGDRRDLRSAPPSSETGIVVSSRARCQTVEAIDAITGETTWVVTSGRDRVECNSADLARKVSNILG